RDFGEQILGACLGLLRVDDDDARLADVDGAVAARAAEAGPDVRLDLLHHHGRRSLATTLGERGRSREEYARRDRGYMEFLHTFVLLRARECADRTRLSHKAGGAGGWGVCRVRR